MDIPSNKVASKRTKSGNNSDGISRETKRARSSLASTENGSSHNSPSSNEAPNHLRYQCATKNFSNQGGHCDRDDIVTTNSEREPAIANSSEKDSGSNHLLSPLLLPSLQGRPLAVSSSVRPGETLTADRSVTLALFYQYVEPPWDESTYRHVMEHVNVLAKNCSVTGRMRLAKEGLNCTLTTHSIELMHNFCRSLREWRPQDFLSTEFKLTLHLPHAQAFPSLKVIPVVELVHYGLEGDKAPPMNLYHGKHLEPAEFHEMMAEDDAVVIDVRNHYEATIGRFNPPNGEQSYIDPKMRKSTEFPIWLDDPTTKEKLRNKKVLLYCTGGIRCEAAGSLLKYKMMETDLKEVGIQEVYQLQGGIDKYFKHFPDGGYWKGKNYVFDKRFAHAPVEKDAPENRDKPMAQCQACAKPWDTFRGKRRCPTCGVPSLICRDCIQADQDGSRKLDRSIQCDLCVEQGIRSKKELRVQEKRKAEEYERLSKAKGCLLPRKITATKEVVTQQASKVVPNPNNVTRLFLKNMCRKKMTEDILMDFLPGITHIVWKTDRTTGQFFGQGWIEMESPEAAAIAVSRSGQAVLGRPLYISYQSPDSKDAWPPPRSAVARSHIE